MRKNKSLHAKELNERNNHGLSYSHVLIQYLFCTIQSYTNNNHRVRLTNISHKTQYITSPEHAQLIKT